MITQPMPTQLLVLERLVRQAQAQQQYALLAPPMASVMAQAPQPSSKNKPVKKGEGAANGQQPGQQPSQPVAGADMQPPPPPPPPMSPEQDNALKTVQKVQNQNQAEQIEEAMNQHGVPGQQILGSMGLSQQMNPGQLQNSPYQQGMPGFGANPLNQALAGQPQQPQGSGFQGVKQQGGVFSQNKIDQQGNFVFGGPFGALFGIAPNAYATVQGAMNNSPQNQVAVEAAKRRLPVGVEEKYKADAQASTAMYGKVLDQENKISDTYDKAMEPFKAVTQSYSVLQGYYQASAKSPSAFNDLGMVYELIKMYDPNAVKEGEMANVDKASRTVPKWALLAYNKAFNGQRFDQSTRGKIVNAAAIKYNSVKRISEDLTNQYAEKTRRYGGDPSRTLVDYSAKSGKGGLPTRSKAPKGAKGWDTEKGAIIPIDQLPDDAQETKQTSKTSVNGNVVPVESLPEDNGNFFQNPDAEMVNTGDQASVPPIGLADRAKLSFADDKGREAFLKDRFKFVTRLENGKFAVGDDPRDLRPIDPEGVFNDVLGDIADVVSEIPVLAGQIAGASAGVAGGPGGVVAGGMAGSVVGEGVRQGVGKALGVNQRDPMEVATDMTISGVFGGAGEALGQLGKIGAKQIIAPALAKAADDLLKTKAVSGKDTSNIVRGMAKIFNIAAGVDEDATLTAGRYGFVNTFAKENVDRDLAPRTIGRLSNELVGGATAKERELSQAVYSAGRDLHMKTQGARVVDVTTVYDRLVKDLKEIGLLESGNKMNQHSPLSGKSFFKNLLQELSGKDALVLKENKIGRFGKVVGQKSNSQFLAPEKKISVQKALQIRKAYGAAFDNLSPQEQAIAYRALNGEANGVVKGISNQLDEIATKVGSKNYLDANEAFSRFRDLTQQLRQSGLDVKNPISANAFLQNVDSRLSLSIDAYKKLDDLLPTKTYDRAMMWNAAQRFTSSNPNLLRFSMIAGLLGAGWAFGSGGGPLEKATKISLGVAVGSPAGIRTILSAGEKAGGKIARGAIRSAQRATNPGNGMQRADSATLSQLARLVYRRNQNGKQR